MFDTSFHIWVTGFIAVYFVGGFVFDQAETAPPDPSRPSNPMAIGIKGLIGVAGLWPYSVPYFAFICIRSVIRRARKPDPNKPRRK